MLPHQNFPAFSVEQEFNSCLKQIRRQMTKKYFQRKLKAQAVEVIADLHKHDRVMGSGPLPSLKV